MRAYRGKKTKTDPVQEEDRPGHGGGCEGSLKIVGTGPGDLRYMSRRAKEAIEECDAIVGYKTYIKLLGDLVHGKEVRSFGMREEVERARDAIDLARSGKRVCVVSSGDPGIYGMAGLVLELLDRDDLDRIRVEICPGIIAATACAALLGAPLMHDFAAISLSDLLTDLDAIERRIDLALRADFVIILYNPKSTKRTVPFKKACEILSRHKPADTPVGIVRNAYRGSEEVSITTLGKMPTVKNIDMATTIIVGNSTTYVKGRYMITPRGYKFGKTGTVPNIRPKTVDQRP